MGSKSSSELVVKLKTNHMSLNWNHESGYYDLKNKVGLRVLIGF